MRGVERFDAIVVGAGPAGSTAAFRLSSAGARVLLLDRARFPRDKVCAGWVTPAVRQQAIAGSLLRHVAQPDDVAEVIVLLASHQARYITGQIIHMA